MEPPVDNSLLKAKPRNHRLCGHRAIGCVWDPDLEGGVGSQSSVLGALFRHMGVPYPPGERCVFEGMCLDVNQDPRSGEGFGSTPTVNPLQLPGHFPAISSHTPTPHPPHPGFGAGLRALWAGPGSLGGYEKLRGCGAFGVGSFFQACFPLCTLS